MGAAAKQKNTLTDAEVEAQVAAELAKTPDTDGPSDDTATAEPTKKEKKPRFTALPAERTAWIAKNARPAVSACLCGCGGTTKGRFVPGHDATLKESLKASVAAGDTDAQAALETFGW